MFHRIEGPTVNDGIDTLVLVQGAVHTSCFDDEGPFSSVPACVRGVVLVTHTTTDNALRIYADTWRSGLGRAIGSVGARLPRGKELWCNVEEDDSSYAWGPGPKLINVDVSAHIPVVPEQIDAAHNNFMVPPV